jgi:tyrosyl-DNA phosphodiesterase-1
MDTCTRAIALSLQDASLGSKDAPISIDEDEEDIISSRKDGFDLTAATPAPNSGKSLARPSSVQGRSSQVGQERPINTSTETPNGSETAPPAASFMSDRARMEQERLERLKRLRPDLSPATKPSSSKRARSSPPSSDTTTEDEDEDVPQKCVSVFGMILSTC